MNEPISCSRCEDKYIVFDYMLKEKNKEEWRCFRCIHKGPIIPWIPPDRNSPGILHNNYEGKILTRFTIWNNKVKEGGPGFDFIDPDDLDVNKFRIMRCVVCFHKGIQSAEKIFPFEYWEEPAQYDNIITEIRNWCKEHINNCHLDN